LAKIHHLETVVGTLNFCNWASCCAPPVGSVATPAARQHLGWTEGGLMGWLLPLLASLTQLAFPSC